MTDDASVSRWLDGLRAGDGDDIRRLWDRYFQRLVELARARLPAPVRRAVDEEDVALSAFHSFCERAGRGRFPRLEDRDDLWRLLSTITARKVVESVRHHTRLKRGGGRAPAGSGREGDDPLAQIIARGPTPDDAAQFAEDYERLFARLSNPTLRAIALRKLDGDSSEAIAAALGVSARTVDRKLQVIRALWEQETGDPG